MQMHRRWSWIVALFVVVAGATLRAAEVTVGTLSAGTKFETPYYVIDSGKPGPLVMITGGVHGNEPAGHRAADRIRCWPITAGRMIVVPACNPPGLKANTRNIPGEPAGDPGNLNRLFPKIGGPDEAVGEPARTLWAFVQQHKPDWFIDLHEGFDFHGSNPKSVGSSVIHFGSDPKAARIAAMMLDAVNKDVTDPKRKFVPIDRGPIEGSIARAAAERLKIPGIICETTTKDQPLLLRVQQHRTMVHVLLSDLGMMSASLADLVPSEAPATTPAPQTAQ